MINLCSWNVNGIRAINKKGFTDWLNKSDFQVIGLQEIKATEDKIPTELIDHEKYNLFSHPAKRPGYSGVACLVNKNLKIQDYLLLNMPEFDDEGRVQVLEFEKFIFFNCYLPNGGRDHSRVPYKLDCSEETMKLAIDLKQQKNKPIIMCGDFNTAHQEIDLKNPKTNQKTTGFLPHEREWMSHFLENGFVDIFRELHPEEEGHYTWWSYRNNCRERNIGWRIDYFMISPELKVAVNKAKILHEVHGSDHCPISLSLNLD